MNIKKKNFIFCLVGMFIFTALLSCGIFAAVTRSVSFNLALVTKPNVYFALTITHVNGNTVGADANKTGFLIFDNRATNAGSVVSWATVNQNCIVLNQVMAGANMPDITPGTTITLKVANYTNEAGKYLHLGLNYLPIQYQDFTMNNGYGVANLAYNASESFTITTQNILANTYVQIPFLAEIDAERFTATINTNQYATMVRNSGTIKAGENYTAEFTSTQEKPYFHFVVNAYEETLVDDVLTIVEKEYTFTNRTGILELPSDILLGNITVNANSITEWNGEVLAYDPNATFSGGNGLRSDKYPYLISTALDWCQLLANGSMGVSYRDKYFLITNDITLNQCYADYQLWDENTEGLNNIPYGMLRFDGDLDGNNYNILGIYSTMVDVGFCGLNYGVIKNLTFGGGYIFAKNNAGASSFCATNQYGGIMQNLKSYINIDSEVTQTGGIAGINSGTIKNCEYYGNISSTARYTGGITGNNRVSYNNADAIILNSVNHGNISSNTRDIGGIVGWNCAYGTPSFNNANFYGGLIINCYNKGDITGTSNCGGIAGWFRDGTINNCYSTGVYTGNSDIGAICGNIDLATINNVYYETSKKAFGVNTNSTTTNITALDLTTSSFITTLNNGFIAYADGSNSIAILLGDYKSWTTGTDGYPTFA